LADTKNHHCADDSANFSIITEKFHFEFCGVPIVAVVRCLISSHELYTALRAIRRATDWSVLLGGIGGKNIASASEFTTQTVVGAP
tara:strand:- start:27 stop:284 length:258 start_codon:yes stop_codon:yes gene_type:complete